MAVTISGTTGIQTPASTNSGTSYANPFSGPLVGNVTGNLTGNVTGVLSSGGSITQAAAYSTTSGTAFDYTGIPSWVKRITVLFNGVSISNLSYVQVQIGSGTIVTTGYLSTSNYSGSVASSGSSSTTGFHINDSGGSDLRTGSLTLVYVGSNIWNSFHSIGVSGGTTGASSGGGYLTLSGTLDRLRITTVNGTDTFDAGIVNIIYEG